MATNSFVCPNCGATHDSDTPGACFLEMLVAVVRDRGTVDESVLTQAAGTIDINELWDDWMDPAASELEKAAKALVPKPPRQRRRGVPAAARVRAVPQPTVPTKTYQVLMGSGERKLYQAPDREQAEAMHKASHPRDKFQQIVEIRR